MITDQTVIDHIGILEDGQIQVRAARRFYDGTVLVAQQYQRQVLEPGQPVSALPERVQAVCRAVWTPAVVSAYATWKAAQARPTPGTV